MGGVIEVAWAINANHGGGSSIRLCPSNSDLSEACFQRTVLKASRNISWIQEGSDKSSRREIPAKRTTVGTFPAGSEWTRNPIPDREDSPLSPPLGLIGHGPFSWNITITGGGPPAPPPPPTPAPAPRPADRCNMPESSKIDCGHGATKHCDCEASGCCWHPAGEGSKTPWCYRPSNALFHV